ncbi:hypothetical protein [Fluviibacter phosphoraccumulans]|uniref:hypothetical protein n=1 Tax=Fluviibacter phosphoraccumulans TaxID=1751046 RepID=UPI0010B537C4|nr:hypothetical protein [Fluviibacter phosphoraccumulans]BCA65815.1 hypothetical protein SHINM1_014170 [Fluviibacter phosphoraccumulans]
MSKIVVGSNLEEVICPKWGEQRRFEGFNLGFLLFKKGAQGMSFVTDQLHESPFLKPFEIDEDEVDLGTLSETSKDEAEFGLVTVDSEFWNRLFPHLIDHADKKSADILRTVFSFAEENDQVLYLY